MPPYAAVEVLFAKESIIMGSIMIHLGKLFNDFDRKCIQWCCLLELQTEPTDVDVSNYSGFCTARKPGLLTQLTSPKQSTVPGMLLQIQDCGQINSIY